MEGGKGPIQEEKKREVQRHLYMYMWKHIMCTVSLAVSYDVGSCAQSACQFNAAPISPRSLVLTKQQWCNANIILHLHIEIILTFIRSRIKTSLGST